MIDVRTFDLLRGPRLGGPGRKCCATAKPS